MMPQAGPQLASPPLGSSNIHIRPPNSSSPFASASANASTTHLGYFSATQQPPGAPNTTGPYSAAPDGPATLSSSSLVPGSGSASPALDSAPSPSLPTGTIPAVISPPPPDARVFPSRSMTSLESLPVSGHPLGMQLPRDRVVGAGTNSAGGAGGVTGGGSSPAVSARSASVSAAATSSLSGLSSSTAATSTTTLTSAATSSSASNNTPHPVISRMMSAPIVPIIKLASNRPPSAKSSLFQVCAGLKARFEAIPGLEPYVLACYEAQAAAAPSSSVISLPAGADSPVLDPVSFIWTFFRLGASLCALFNVLEPNARLKTDMPQDVKAAKRAVYDFVQGCKAELGYSDDQLFTISNVFSDNTQDLLKVIRTVELVLKSLVDRNLIAPPPSDEDANPLPFEPKDKRDRVVEEILMTERKFVQDLEVLVDYQGQLQRAGLVSVDTIHTLFPNLSNLVDFQRRLLIGVEYNATLPPESQRFGSLFGHLEDAFEVYKGYSLNQQRACDIAIAEAPKLGALSHVVEPTYELPAMLIKPIQRICKYPLLFKELIKYTPEEWPFYQELYEGLDTVERITFNVNESQRQLENVQSLRDLRERLRDWRGHNLADFGDLLHEGVFPVVKAGFEREYHLYLFENIILCCKESTLSKKSIPLAKKKDRNSQSKRSSLVLKGRIYMAYITNVSISRRDGGFLLHLSWGKDDTNDVGFFEIRFRHEELLTKWETTIKQMVARYDEHSQPNQQKQQLQQQRQLQPGSDAQIGNGSGSGAGYDEGSEEEYDEGLTMNAPQSAAQSMASFVKPIQTNLTDGDSSSPYSPMSTSTTATTVGPRTISSSSTATNYPFPYSGTNMVTDELSGLKISNGAKSTITVNQPFEDSTVSLAGSVNSGASRNRSASTPSFTHQNTSEVFAANGNGHDNMSSSGTLPPIPPMPNGAHANAQRAARIKSESAAVRKPGPESWSSPPAKPQHHKVKLHFLEDTFLIMVPDGITYSQLLERVERKIRLCGKQTPSPLRIKYKDEDEDFVSINSDEDILMALELLLENSTPDSQGARAIPPLTIWIA